jgi:hypothetical protein
MTHAVYNVINNADLETIMAQARFRQSQPGPKGSYDQT